MRPEPRHAALLLLAGAVALGGCTREINERLVLGMDTPLPAIEPREQELPMGVPSVTGLERHWEPVVFVVPVNGVAHPPDYAPPTFMLDELPRQRGEYPTALSALDLGEPDAGDEVLQALRSHGQAVLDAALILPRLVIRPPNATDWSPERSYERAPAAAITAETAPPPVGEPMPEVAGDAEIEAP